MKLRPHLSLSSGTRSSTSSRGCAGCRAGGSRELPRQRLLPRDALDAGQEPRRDVDRARALRGRARRRRARGAKNARARANEREGGERARLAEYVRSPRAETPRRPPPLSTLARRAPRQVSVDCSYPLSCPYYSYEYWADSRVVGRAAAAPPPLSLGDEAEAPSLSLLSLRAFRNRRYDNVDALLDGALDDETWFQVGAIRTYDGGLKGPSDPDAELRVGQARVRAADASSSSSRRGRTSTTSSRTASRARRATTRTATGARPRSRTARAARRSTARARAARPRSSRCPAFCRDAGGGGASRRIRRWEAHARTRSPSSAAASPRRTARRRTSTGGSCRA